MLNWSRFGKVYLRTSNIPAAGIGLFANVDIKINDVVTAYTGHYASMPIEGSAYNARLDSTTVIHGHNRPEDMVYMDRSQSLVTGHRNSCARNLLINGGSFQNDCRGTTTFTNNCCRASVHDDYVPAELLKVIKKLNTGKPIMFVMVIVALEDIHKDSELFSCYGDEYWGTDA